MQSYCAAVGQQADAVPVHGAHRAAEAQVQRRRPRAARRRQLHLQPVAHTTPARSQQSKGQQREGTTPEGGRGNTAVRGHSGERARTRSSLGPAAPS